ncbi:TAP domain protein [Metarhizium album ARSEF 1941]|uniref:TAP domain protein n=1 Tax=Metarhizium album (strain ARSEF 1941) TaxID=1081103 RepID=A0A0B2WT11_METAS|nr:TAP domain protein [Metarhizium album ARSEF 1941]KHN96632.1 TAP domain protein [Metarhizium album ARSEF 1941]
MLSAGGNFQRLWSKLVLLGINAGALWSMTTFVQGVAAAPADRHVRQAQEKPGRERFPNPNDPFHFIPCLSSRATRAIPLLNDADPQGTWTRLFDPNPDNWVWQASLPLNASKPGQPSSVDPYKDRGLYLCGYLDVPLDYLNESDSRISRLAVVKYQVSGVGKKSERTIVVNPGGPGGSGVLFALQGAEIMARHRTNDIYDVLSWDPRGVGLSHPRMSCFPYNGLSDRWQLMMRMDLKESPSARAHLERVNAMNDAIFRSCHERLGDLPRFTSTVSVARDMEKIRAALNETELTGYFASYGTTLAQIYASMFPDRVGRMVLDGMDFARDHRVMGGYGKTALYNTTDVWNDGFLGECVAAGPRRCALAEPINDTEVTLDSLKQRMHRLLDGLAKRPIPTYHNQSGPLIITYSNVVSFISSELYTPGRWAGTARLLRELEEGNYTSATRLAAASWQYTPPNVIIKPAPGQELLNMVVCGDASDADTPTDLGFWESLWRDMTARSFISGQANFATVFPCHNYKKYWPKGAATYRGDFNKPLKNPILLVSSTHDPVTPLRNGRELLKEMGVKNARMIVHHGYGHGSWSDPSNCTNALFLKYFLNGTLPERMETDCYADKKPYRYRPGPKEGSKPGLAELTTAYLSAIPRM